MEIIFKNYADCYREAFVYVTSMEVDDVFAKELSYLQQNVEFPGYRKGKVPAEIIEKNFSLKLNNQVFSGLLSLAVDEINKTRNFESISDLRALTTLKKGEAFSFFLSFFEESSLKNDIDFEKINIEFDEYFYDEKILKERISEFLVDFEESDSKIEEKDKVFLAFANETSEKVDDIEVEAKNIPSLIGKKKGDEIILSMFEIGKFYISRFLGKFNDPLKFKVSKVMKLKRLPLSDENVSKKTSFKTVDEYKENISKSLDMEIERLNESSKRKALREYVAKSAKIEFNRFDFFKFLASRYYRFFSEELQDPMISAKDFISDKKIKEKYTNLLDEYYMEYVETTALALFAKKLNIQPNQQYIDYILYDRAMREQTTVEDVKKKISKEELSEIELFSRIQTLLDNLVRKVSFKAKAKIPYNEIV